MVEAGAGASEARETLRLDRLLVYLRFARTRSAARAMIEGRSLRRNRKHVSRASECVAVGDVLTLVVGGEVRIVEITTLPAKRLSATLAKSCYSEYGRGSDALASAGNTSRP
ncbi:RNA-binding S4 domain-containing protein [Erythrobacter sp. SCSIO 43205]|uniref:S4 domain-containing protein n=1 Tax=Erythrobacter sp. SCSIO 43205 TaxID=2779361 RepID=UPI001CA866A1|nr:S4 domain-containing protein [Erythrobacter sp. SCSIO 43205]UAB78492.1 RNA-binding S4 domain-containing protein [Erythrobacter sp. SCSIO 43205]